MGSFGEPLILLNEQIKLTGLLTLNDCKEEWCDVTGGEEGNLLWTAAAVGFDLAASWNLREGEKQFPYLWAHQ